ncbi:MAG: CRISPR-associated endonuclease Cas3'', partial [Nitrospinota bacterium]
MHNTPWPDGLDTVWAKSPEDRRSRQAESLVHHTWQVLARLADLIHLRPHLPQALHVPRLWHILFWAAFLHDLGKAAKGFQTQLRGKQQWSHRHEVLSLVFVDWIVDGFSPAEQPWLIAAIVSHHKDAGEIEELYAPPD